MSDRGAELTETLLVSAGQLGVARFEWESPPHLGGPAQISRAGGVAVVSDAYLASRPQLAQELRTLGHPPASEAPGDLILAAYLAWGREALPHLNGDYAFIVTDESAGSVWLARSFPGPRPLFYAPEADRLCVASTIQGVLTLLDRPASLDRAVIAETAAGVHWGEHQGTAWQEVKVLDGGWELLWTPGGVAPAQRHWAPHAPPSSVPLEEAAEQLRGLVERSAAERLDVHRPTAIWLSGGYDSPAVAAAAERGAADLRAVSISYPEGDPGREDEIIVSIAEHLSLPVQWIPADAIPIAPDPLEAARARGTPYVHPFADWNRALAATTQREGCRIALGGDGGDQLFQRSPFDLPDLLFRGRWLRWLSAKRNLPAMTFRDALLLSLRGGMPGGLRTRLQRAFPGRDWGDPQARGFPFWFSGAAMEELGLEQRNAPHGPMGFPPDAQSREFATMMGSPYFGRVTSAVGSLALSAGVEWRSPLWDRRIVELALTRPLSDRLWRGSNKRLLRAAFSSALPPSVMAPRASRTGLPNRFLHRLLEERFSGAEGWLGDLRLADLGLVAPARLRSALEAYRTERQPLLGVHLVATLETEAWLRTR